MNQVNFAIAVFLPFWSCCRL